MNYPVNPEEALEEVEIKMEEYAVPENVNPLHVLGTDKILTGIYEKHFVNVEIQSFNSLVNCLNDKTIFSVFMEIEENNFIQFEMK